MNRDRLFASRPETAALGAYKIVTAIQSLTPEEQVLGLACAFKFAAEAKDLDRGQLLHTIERMQRDTKYRHANTFDALERYMEGEL